MNILMMTNTFTPIVGGVEKSIVSFTEQFRRLGHEVMIVAPAFEGMPPDEENVLRLDALQHFNGTDFAINLPAPGILGKLMEKFQPDVVHSHHPFLVGDLALRLAGQYDLPLVFTYHTMFEQYLHYLPIHNDRVKCFVVELSCGYANLCDTVIAPSRSVREILIKRNVMSPIEVIPTGIDVTRFGSGDRLKMRARLGIDPNAYVVGYVGRLETEKNLKFLFTCLKDFLQRQSRAHALIVGDGSQKADILSLFKTAGLSSRVHYPGVLEEQALVDAYHAMDIFAFASHSETQGMVLAEAMAAGVPVVAVEAAGVREVVRDKENGRVIVGDDQRRFVSALEWCADCDNPQELVAAARATAGDFSRGRCSRRLLAVYEKVRAARPKPLTRDSMPWKRLMNRIHTEWDMLKNITEAADSALTEGMQCEKLNL